VPARATCKSFFQKNNRVARALALSFLFAGTFSPANAQTGKSLDFVSTLTNYVELPNLLPSGSYTKEAWVYARSFTDYGNNIISGVSSAFWAPDAYLHAGHLANDNYDYWAVYDVTPLQTNTWYHVAVTFDDATNTITLYKNGVQVGTGTTAGPYSESKLFIGTYNFGEHYHVGWDGMIDEVRIWNIVRTPAQIAAGYNCRVTGDEPGLLAYYNFNQGTAGGTNTSVTNLLDRSDKCVLNHGVLKNFNLTGATSNWVSAGKVIGSCGGSYANINLLGNGKCIADGDNTPRTQDFTSFGTGTLITKEFKIKNTGNALLNIYGVNITGTDASQFTVLTTPASTLGAGAITAFKIQFLPTSGGLKKATVNVNNSDGDEGAYDYAIQATSSLTIAAQRPYTASAAEETNVPADGIVVYPVPANDRIFIRFNDTKLVGTVATLWDQQGKLVKQITISSMLQEVSLDGIPRGFYLLRMQDGSVSKLIKQ
jgi:hypothetical protein